jgi:hypothetical protein
VKKHWKKWIYWHIDTLIEDPLVRSLRGNRPTSPGSASPNSIPLFLKDIDREHLAAEAMANYPCDPLPHLPPGADLIPFNAIRPQRGYVVVGGELPIICDDWAIVSLEPEPNMQMFQGTSQLIRGQFEHRGFCIRQISRCGMGTALHWFISWML